MQYRKELNYIYLYKYVCICKNIYRTDEKKQIKTLQGTEHADIIFNNYYNELIKINRRFKYGVRSVKIEEWRQKAYHMYKLGLPADIIYNIITYTEKQEVYKNIMNIFKKPPKKMLN